MPFELTNGDEDPETTFSVQRTSRPTQSGQATQRSRRGSVAQRRTQRRGSVAGLVRRGSVSERHHKAKQSVKGQWAERRSSFVSVISDQGAHETKSRRRSLIKRLQASRIQAAQLAMDKCKIDFGEWLQLYSSVSFKPQEGRTRGLVTSRWDGQMSAAKCKRVLVMIDRLYFLACSDDGELTVQSLHAALIRFVGGIHVNESSAHRSSQRDLNRLKIFYYRFATGSTANLQTFVRMLGSDEDDNVPGQLVEFVRKIRTLCAAYELFDQDGGGTIDSEEFGATMTKLFRWRPTRYETEKMMAMALGLKHETCDEIDWGGFVRMMTLRHSGIVAERLTQIADSIARLSGLFDCFSTEAPGYAVLDFAISSQDFAQVISATGQQYSDQELQHMLDRIRKRSAEICGVPVPDVEADVTEISFACFVNMLTDTDSQEKQRVELALTEARLLFELYATGEENEDKLISVSDIARFISALCGCKQFEVIRELVDMLDARPDTRLSFPQFVAVMTGSAAECQDLIWSRMRELRNVYSLFDFDHSGAVDLQEFASILKRFGGVEAHKIDESVCAFDLDGNGLLDFAEFTEMMLKGDDRIVSHVTGHVDMLKELYSVVQVNQSNSKSAPSAQSTVAQALVIISGLSKAEAEATATGICNDKEELDLQEFVRLMITTEVQQECTRFKRCLSDLRQAFNVFEQDGLAVIKEKELKVTLQLLGIELNDNDIRDMIDSVDSDRSDGSLSFGEYVNLALPLVLRYRADMFKDEVDIQSRANKIREDFASLSTKSTVPLFSNRQQLDGFMRTEPPKWTKEMAERIADFLTDSCGNPVIKRLDRETCIKFCQQARLVRAAPDCRIVEEDQPHQLLKYMLVVVKGHIEIHLPEGMLATTPRHEVWTAVQQFLALMTSRLKHSLSLWSSFACAPAKIRGRIGILHRMMAETIQEVDIMLSEAIEIVEMTEMFDIWCKPAVISKGIRVLTKLQVMIEASDECQEQCATVRLWLITRPHLHNASSMSAIASVLDSLTTLLLDLRLWKASLEPIFGKGDTKAPMHESSKERKDASGSLLLKNVKQVGTILQGQALGLSSLLSVKYGMDLDHHSKSSNSCTAVAGLGDTSGTGTLMLAFNRDGLIKILSEAPAKFIISLKPFEWLDSDSRAWKKLAMACTPGKYRFGEVVVRAGQRASSVLLLAKGQLKILAPGSSGAGVEPHQNGPSCRDTISIVVAPAIVDMVQKDVAGKQCQQYTMIADASHLEAWWMPRLLFDRFSSGKKELRSSMEWQSQVCTEQIGLIENNLELLELTSSGKNEKLNLELQAIEEKENEIDTNLDQLDHLDSARAEISIHYRREGTSNEMDIHKVVVDVCKDASRHFSLSESGKYADTKCAREHQMQKLRRAADPPAAPYVPVQPNLVAPPPNIGEPPLAILQPKERYRLRQEPLHARFDHMVRSPRRHALSKASANRFVLQQSQEQRPVVQRSAVHGAATPDFIHDFIDNVKQNGSLKSRFNRSVMNLANKIKQIERKATKAAGLPFSECPLALLKSHLKTMDEKIAPKRIGRIVKQASGVLARFRPTKPRDPKGPNSSKRGRPSQTFVQPLIRPGVMRAALGIQNIYLGDEGPATARTAQEESTFITAMNTVDLPSISQPQTARPSFNVHRS